MISPVKTSWPQDLWFYERDGQGFGPTDLGGLQVMARSLHLTPDCAVWKHGETKRTQAASLTLSFPVRDAAPYSLRPEEGDAAAEPFGTPVGLYRSIDEGYLLGFCAGLAHRFGLPPGVFRVLFVLCLPLGIGWAYFGSIALQRFPTRPKPPPPPAAPPSEAFAPAVAGDHNGGTMTSVTR